MDMSKEFAVDPKRLTEGVWHVFTKDTDEIVDEQEIGNRPAVLLASTSNPAFREARQKKQLAIASRRGGELDFRTDRRITAELVAEYIVLDWRNWTIDEGTKEIPMQVPIPYSKERVIEVWTELKWTMLVDRLTMITGDMNAYKAYQEEAVLKN